MNAQPRTKNQERRTGGLPRRPAAGQVATWLPTWRAAFTLIELLVVIVVIAILAGITLPLSKYAIGRANEARKEGMQAKIRSALEEYRTVYGEYPINTLNPATPADMARHYPATYATLDATQSNSTYTSVSFSANTVETIYDVHGRAFKVDYCLTYPLMLKQSDKGARPFMEFPIVDVVYLVTRATAADKFQYDVNRRSKSGIRSTKTVYGIYGDAVKRAKAVDPVTGYQWLYSSSNGLVYTLLLNPF